MSRISYVNGRYLPHKAASIPIEDRGFQFSDGVYEVCKIEGGFILDLADHLDRLRFSLDSLSIPFSMHRTSLECVIKEVIRRNNVDYGLVYIQVTRGVFARNHVFPPLNVPPTLVISAQKQNPDQFAMRAQKGLHVITVPENRWKRVDIKSINLLGNVLAREEAKKRDSQEAWFVDENGFITEGAASNAWIINAEGVLITRALKDFILGGITRKTVINIAKKLSIPIEERPFSIEEAVAAKESFITAATITVMPVVTMNGFVIGDKNPGKITVNLRNYFFEMAEKTAVL